MKTRTLIAALALTALASPRAASALAPPHAERLDYEVRWRGVRVASLRLRLGCPTARWRTAALTTSTAGLADDIHSFRIRLDSFFDPERVLSLQGRTRITEEGRTRSYRSTFSKAPAVSVDATLFGAARAPQEIALPTRSHDLLSWMLNLRWQTEWGAGATRRYHVWDGWKLISLDARVRGAEVISTPRGTYRAWAVELTRTRLAHEGDFSPLAPPETIGVIWFTTGGDHVIVGMDFESRIGPAHIRLVNGGRERCE